MGRSSKSKRNARKLRTVEPERQIQEKAPEWVIEINARLKEGHTYDAGRSWSIFRVPNNLREVQRSAFVPKIISIGPFHYGDPRLQAMEEHKMRYLVRLLGGKFEENGVGEDQRGRDPIKLEDLVEAMKLFEQKTRACYSEFFDIPSEDFVQMMVVDGCFVVELLRQFYKFNKEEDIDDPIFTTRWMLRTLQRDLLMLENQLPFFILQELFRITTIHQEKEPLLPELTVTFFDPLLPRKDSISKLTPGEEYDHLLDLFRSTFLSTVRARVKAHGWLSQSLDMPLAQDKHLIHCAVELQEAGLGIRKRENSDLLDIRFSDGVLQIPPLRVDDNTVPLLFNFLAYEQYDEEAKPFFTNFFTFLDSLIYSKVDVQILHKYGIINHMFGSEKDVANLINKIGREIVNDQDQCYLSLVMKGVNDHCKPYYESKLSLWWRNLIRIYFSNPWTVLSLLAAISFLLLTFVQTLYAIEAYYKNPP